MPVTKSPLRYPGGKSQLFKFIENIFVINNFDNIIYCEPFSGGFGVGLELLHSNMVNSLIINDYDIGIYSIWYAILNDSDKFCRLINDTQINIQEWNKQKIIYENNKNNNYYSLELAFSTFFLNRTNISGIISGGPIGGKHQDKKYLLDCRFNKKKLLEKIDFINSNRNRIELYNLEANELINKIIKSIPPSEIFLFFDPPYYNQGKNLYLNFFKHNDHVNLSKNIKKLEEYSWILTYDNSNEIKDIFSTYNKLEYKIQYSVNKVRKEKELMYHSRDLLVESFDKVIFI